MSYLTPSLEGIEPFSKVPILEVSVESTLGGKKCLGHYLYLSFADCRVNNRLVLHIVRFKDLVIHGLLRSCMISAYVMLQSWFMDTLPFVSVHACSCTGECPSAGGRGCVDTMVGDRRYIPLTKERRLCGLSKRTQDIIANRVCATLRVLWNATRCCDSLTSGTGYPHALLRCFQHPCLLRKCVCS